MAHRALWDLSKGRPENSVAAVRAAVEHGYGIEIDLQLSADGVAMVFHDYDLDRLTGARGPVRARSAADLSGIALAGGDEGIPTLTDVLEATGGRVPLLIELKEQSGRARDRDVGAVLDVLATAPCPVALMSFDPEFVEALLASSRCLLLPSRASRTSS